MFKKFLALLLTLAAASAFAAVDVNKASQAELESVKGVGPAVSGRILEERKKSDFKDWNDLVARVKGVGEHNAAKFSDGGLTVNGVGYKAADEKPAKKSKNTKAENAKAPATKASDAKK